MEKYLLAALKAISNCDMPCLHEPRFATEAITHAKLAIELDWSVEYFLYRVNEACGLA